MTELSILSGITQAEAGEGQASTPTFTLFAGKNQYVTFDQWGTQTWVELESSERITWASNQKLSRHQASYMYVGASIASGLLSSTLNESPPFDHRYTTKLELCDQSC